jgi:hypothetical protein
LAFSIVYSFALFVQEISKQVIQANLLVFIAKGLLFNSYIWRSQAYVYLDASADPKQSLACYGAALHASSATFFSRHQAEANKAATAILEFVTKWEST